MAKKKYDFTLNEFERKILRNMKKYADIKGYELNPDKKLVNIIIKGLARNYRKYKAFYCPCRRVTGDPSKDRLIICPCTYHKEEIMKNGKCHCGLFVNKVSKDIVMKSMIYNNKF